MENDMKKIVCRYLLIMSLCFTLGLLFGLLFHLPAVSFHDEQFTTQEDSRFPETLRLNGKPVGKRNSRQIDDKKVRPQLTVMIGNSAKPEDTSDLNSAFDSASQIVDGVFWSNTLEKTVPRQFSDLDSANWRRLVHSNRVVDVKEGCGRMQNRMVTFEDGTQSCARYRINTDQIQGEVYSFYLSQLLGIGNIPPLVIVTADLKSPQWMGVGNKVAEARWNEEKPLILTQFVKDLSPAYIPHHFREENRQFSQQDLLGKSQSELLELVQWSDLIILDYLTGNLDRIVNNLFNLQWNSEIMSSPAHNLEKSGNLLVFLDNESGLFHGYRLLEKYQPYHDRLLKSLCIFRKDTVEKLRDFHMTGEIGSSIHAIVKDNEKHHGLLPNMPEKNLAVLNERIGHVLSQVESCQERR